MQNIWTSVACYIPTPEVDAGVVVAVVVVVLVAAVVEVRLL